MFKAEEETTTAVAEISFPSLPLNIFGKEALFSLAMALGKPLQVNMATKNETRLSCARVKVKADLLSEFPKRIKIVVRKLNSEISKRWITIKYDYIMCMIQGHNEQQCYVLHPELFSDKKDKKSDEDNSNDAKNDTTKGKEPPLEKDNQKFMEQKNKNREEGESHR